MASLQLLKSYKQILKEPLEGILCELANEDDPFEWDVYMEGPPDSFYYGGIWKLRLSFPPEFPMQPPVLKFESKFWHPNVYTNGIVCISILHNPGVDELSGESADERWLPTRPVSSILVSVWSLLISPNFDSPANVDASVEWRDNPQTFKKGISTIVEESKKQIPKSIQNRIPHPESNVEEKQKFMDQIKKESQVTKDIMDEELLFDSREPSSTSDEEEEEKVTKTTESEKGTKTKPSPKKGPSQVPAPQNSQRSCCLLQ